jgi:hypothetical protein
MAKPNKTTETEADVAAFVNSFADTEQKKADSFRLIELLREWSGEEARMWGPSIIGFGSFHYKYASGHEGDAPVLGFSPRKAALTLYVFSPNQDNQHLLEGLGKYKISKACIYVKKLADLDLSVLEKLCRSTMQYIAANHVCQCRGAKR